LIVLLNQVLEHPSLLLVLEVLLLEVLLILVALHLSEDLLLGGSKLLLKVTMDMATMEITIRAI
jgi:hypothetical protein